MPGGGETAWHHFADPRERRKTKGWIPAFPPAPMGFASYYPSCDERPPAIPVGWAEQGETHHRVHRETVSAAARAGESRRGGRKHLPARPGTKGWIPAFAG